MFKVLITIILISGWSMTSYSAEVSSKSSNSSEVFKLYKTSKPKEVLEWLNPKEKDKTLVILKNDYFTVSYPDCFSLVGIGNEDSEEVEKSPIVVFNRTAKCNAYQNKNDDSNSLQILANQDGISLSDLPLLIQKIKINGNEGLLQAGIFDSGDGDKKEITLRWEISVTCKRTKYRMIGAVSPGKTSTDRIQKKDYSFPEDFKKIVSSFQCK